MTIDFDTEPYHLLSSNNRVDIGMMAAILFSAIVDDTGIVEGDIPFHWIQHPQIVLKRWDVNFYSKMPLTLRKEHISQFSD